MTVTVPISVTTVYPLSGSLAGGSFLTITGDGFTPDNPALVTIAGSPCVIIATTYSSISCRTPPAPGGVSASFPIVVSGSIVAGVFSYDSALTPLAIALSPMVLPAAVSGHINITVTSPAGVSGVDAIFFGVRPCTSVSLTALDAASVLLRCTLLRAQLDLVDDDAAVPPSVYVTGQGLASVTPGLTLDVTYFITSVSPAVFGIAGGTLITSE